MEENQLEIEIPESPVRVFLILVVKEGLSLFIDFTSEHHSDHEKKIAALEKKAS